MEFQCAGCHQGCKGPRLLSCFHFFCEDCLSKHIGSGTPAIACPDCRRLTPVVMGNHSSDLATELPSVEPSYCEEHSTSDLSLYCETCQKLICVECGAGSHHSHHHGLLSSLFPTHKQEVEDKLEALNSKLLHCHETLASLESEGTVLASKERHVESTIRDLTSLIENAVQSRREELCEQLHTAVQAKREAVSAQAEEVQLHQALLSSCVEFTLEHLRSSSPEKLMAVKSALLLRVNLLLKNEQALDFTSSSEDIRLEASPQFLVQKCLEFGEILSGGAAAADQDSTMLSFTPTPADLTLSKLLIQRLRTPLLMLTDLKGPCGVAIGLNGEVVVAEGCGDRVSVFSREGKWLRSFGQCGSGLGELACPCEVAVDQEGHFLVVDGSNRRLQKFSSEGKCLACVGGNESEALHLTEPDGLAVHPLSQKVYMVDNNTHHIHILNPDLSFCAAFGKEGEAGGQLRFPWGVACSCSGEVFVTDSGNCRVQVFTAEGQFLRMFGEKGSGPKQLMWPTGISISHDGCVVYVSDYGNHRVSLFTSAGQFLKTLGKRGKGEGEFGNTRGLKVDRSGLLYVCDTDNNRVVLY